MMETERTKRISPIIDVLAPEFSDPEKEAMTLELRAYLACLYEWYCRLDREGLLEPDSSDSAEDGRFRVANPPTP